MDMINKQIRMHLKERGWDEAEITPAVIRYFEAVWRHDSDLHEAYAHAEDNVRWSKNLVGI